MSEIMWSFDGLLTVSLVVLAWRAVTAPDLFKGVVLFIAFGVLMAVAWTRLDAADIALAEAAIGAGLTGALLLNGLAATPQTDANARRGLKAEQVLSLFWLAAFVVMLVAVVWQLPREAEGLSVQVEERLGESGALNPVTAVLLNFRGYDTLLEVGVLLLAVVGAWSLGNVREDRAEAAPPGVVLSAFVRTLAPLVIVVAAYLLWSGAKAPGGAFQAGAVLSAAGVLLLLSRAVRSPSLRRWPQRAILLLGFAGFLALGIGVMPTGRAFLEYPRHAASDLVLLVETLLTLSIAAILVCLFAVGPRQPEAGDERTDVEEEQ